MSINIVVPELGESVVEARVAKWLKQPGDHVAVGEALVELETEKIDLEVSADRAGVLTNIVHGQGADVKVGDTLAVMEETSTGGTAGGTAGAAGASSAARAAGAVPQVLQVLQVPQVLRATGGGSLTDVRATPTARNVARAHDVDLKAVAAAGPRVTKQDVLRASTPVAAPEAPEAPVGTRGTAPVAPVARVAPVAPEPVPPLTSRPETRERMTKRRATIARRLVEAQHTAAMLTTFNEVDMSAVMSLRARRKDAFQANHGVGIGIASFFVKATLAALRAFPQLNAEIQGDEIVFKHYHDIGMAVGAEGGLVVPVIRDADRLGFAGIELAIRDFARRAGDGTLTLDDLRGGTFTITNGGVFGSLMSTPILNPPQVGILGLHKIMDRAVPVGGQVVIRPMMYIALSYDHRLVDGREAVQFLVKVKDYVEDPAWMLLDS